MSVSLYFTQLKSLWDELNSIVCITPCICGNAKSNIDQQNQDRAMEFLQGPHDRFSAIRSQILLMELFPSIQRIHNLVKKSRPPPCTSTTNQLTLEQYNKLLALLSKEESGGSSAHLAGPSNEEEDWSG
ncbi:hypothetical protein Patl1_07320 [Pistacia atlantica]|uniref:Uncharacterized protein n=1 Tax=Pistacia atlantica TaxID=434234 RepID=A0ACC1AJ98_9ROSI|nr:hypothetical protein Patl1_07320 [Pistacia atlantica]